MTGEKQDNLWPLPEFYFKVDIDGISTMSFKEVSGLEVEYDLSNIEQETVLILPR